MRDESRIFGSLEVRESEGFWFFGSSKGLSVFMGTKLPGGSRELKLMGEIRKWGIWPGGISVDSCRVCV